MVEEVLLEIEERMEKAVQSIQHDFVTIRTGRANPSLLTRVQVDYYGEVTPIQQLASVSVPEPRMLTIQPYDKKIIADIEKAILKSDLGLNPSNDGHVIRLIIPPLTEERRKELVKQSKKIAEEGKIAIRNVRRDGIEHIKKMEKSEGLPKDSSKDAQDEIQKLTDEYIEKVEKVLHNKEKEIMEQ